MNDESTNDRVDVSDIAEQLKAGKLSRAGLLGRLRGLGIGFGAAFVLGMTGAHAANAPDAGVAVRSTNTALNSIIQSGPQLPTAESTPLQQVAWYHRFFRRFFSRFYRRF